MKIGAVQLDSPTVLAPLAGVTHLPFRVMVKHAGCGLVCSEMVSASGLLHKSQKTRQLMAGTPEERPLSVQLFGAEPELMTEAARMVEEAGADILDINFGCSVKKILKSGSGSALMKEPEKSKKILESIRKAIRIPLTIKIRTGWDASGDQALQIAKIAQDAGVDAVAVHPRTATQGFSGTPNREIIRRVKEALSIPVIGNGDVTTAVEARALVDATGCDGVMIGRAALANPWLLAQTAALLAGAPVPEITTAMRFDAMIDYTREAVSFFGEIHACRMMRSRLGWLIKGLPGSSRFREASARLSTLPETLALIDIYRREVETSHSPDRSFSQ